jgi:hypothetical protein
MEIIRLLRRWARLYARNLLTLPSELAETKVLLAKLLNTQIAARGILPDIREAEFRVFSQFGEDGIIQYLVRQVGLPQNLHTFVEFGVETYQEANTRFLLVNNNWRGLVIDGSPDNIARVRDDPIFWRHELNATAAFINADNINQLIGDGGYRGEIGLLSVDIDGNDYWVWDRIDVVDPVIVVAEYNSVFGSRHAVTIPYDPKFIRARAHFSHLYWGCSLKALELLGRKKGYALVGSNSAGNNAFFVRRDRLSGLREITAEQAYVESKFRESRDLENKLTYLSGDSRSWCIRDMPVFDVEQGDMKKIGALVSPKEEV